MREGMSDFGYSSGQMKINTMMTVKYGKRYTDFRKRLTYVQSHIKDFLEAHAMNYAVRFIKIFQDGIRRNDFGLFPLKAGTIAAKRNMTFKKGRGKGRSKIDVPYKKPETPLYGAGLDIDEKTYINMLRIFKKKDHFLVAPSRAKHHKSDLKLKDLFDVHEKGRTIIMPNGTAIVIPPRPALLRAYIRFLNEKKQSKPAEKFKRELTKYIYTGESSWFKTLIDKKAEGEKYKEK
jgi:hypothetical protein